MVPYARHKDWFDPRYREEDHYEVHGMTLIEKPSEEVKAQRQREIAKALQNEEDALRKIQGAMQDMNAIDGVQVVSAVRISHS